MKLVQNTIFDENMLYEDILHCADRISETLKEEGKTGSEKYVSKMYGNVFALLLRNGCLCGKDVVDDKVVYCMNINGRVYRCEENLLKNVLFKDFEEVMSKALRE